MARSQPEALRHPFHRRHDAPRARGCDYPGCREEGLYRAPRSRDRLREYFYFCLDHVRDYNRAWDYFAGMNEAEIESELRADACWHRPSWPFASIDREAGADACRRRARDDFGFFAEDQWPRGGRHWRHERARSGRRERTESTASRPHSAEDRALAELELHGPVTFESIKARYKELVKRLHPDANGGDCTYEDRLKTVNQAYATLRACYAP